MITLALSKGRIFEETLPLLKAAGIEVLEDPEKSRKLILTTNQPDVRVLVVRATDVPTYVQYGGADLGITGRDTLLEHGSEGLYQPLDLQIAKCRISVAVRSDFDYPSAVKKGSRLTVATKYVAISRDFFAAKGVHVDLIKLYGSMELAPLVGMADAIVDLDVGAQTHQLVDVHEAVFKNGFGYFGRALRHGVERHELGLHVGRKTGVFGGAEILRPELAGTG